MSNHYPLDGIYGEVLIVSFWKMAKVQLSALGLKEPQINIIEVDAFEYPDSGKLRRFLKLKLSHAAYHKPYTCGRASKTISALTRFPKPTSAS